VIGVVVPLYNKVATVRRAIESVLAQTYKHWQLVIVDDGSTDGGAEQIAGLAGARVVRQTNRGVSAARNAGAALGDAPLVAYLDADDEWLPHHLEDLADLAQRFPGAVGYATAYERVSAHGVQLLRLPQRSSSFEIADYFAFCQDFGAPLSASSIAVRRETLQAIGGFPEGIAQGEDLVTWARLTCRGTIAFCSRVSARYHVADSAPVRPAEPDRVAAALAELAAPGARAYRASWHRSRAALFCELGDSGSTLRELAIASCVDRPAARDLALALSLTLPRGPREALFAWRRRQRFQPHAAAKASVARSNV
jgi:cellulose synthase/poly-beta-1,6-N-acetylglucosamine synthase-like glycosyltransferase